MDNHAFECLLGSGWPGLSREQIERVSLFRDQVVEENKKQNITRLLSPQDFFDGHVLDVRELLASGLLDFPALDLGSGAGVPGLLAALIQGDSWVLAESEGTKARFLSECVQKLGLESVVKVFSGRAEAFLKAAEQQTVKSVVARAVGPVDRVYTWIRDCSTWNNLVLLKGPRWEEEWGEFLGGPHKQELRLVGNHPYLIGSDAKQRVIVRLERVPRGTISSKMNESLKKVAQQKKRG